MKISITPTGQSPFLLADDDAGVIPGAAWPQGAGGQIRDGLLNQQERRVQAVDGVRAPFRANLPRYNVENRLEFVVARSFATTAACQLFIARHPGQVPVQGVLAVLHQAPDGAANLYLKGAVVQFVRCTRQVGVSCLFQYLIRGNADWSTSAT